MKKENLQELKLLDAAGWARIPKDLTKLSEEQKEIKKGDSVICMNVDGRHGDKTLKLYEIYIVKEVFPKNLRLEGLEEAPLKSRFVQINQIGILMQKIGYTITKD